MTLNSEFHCYHYQRLPRRCGDDPSLASSTVMEENGCPVGAGMTPPVCRGTSSGGGCPVVAGMTRYDESPSSKPGRVAP